VLLCCAVLLRCVRAEYSEMRLQRIMSTPTDLFWTNIWLAEDPSFFRRMGHIFAPPPYEADSLLNTLILRCKQQGSPSPPRSLMYARVFAMAVCFV
jgi:hypothetical protein